MITSIEEIKSIEDAIEYFENKGMPLTEDEKAMLHSDFFLKKNSDKKLVKICEANKCYDGVWCEGKDYCSYHESCLSKLREYKSINNIQEIETFTTLFNGNCGYVINYDYSASSSYPYYVWIVVYEPAVRSMSENLSIIKYDNWGSLPYAREKAQELRNKLQNGSWYDYPMLEVHSKANSYEYFSNIITSPYVMKKYVPRKQEVRYGPFLAPGQMDVEVPIDNINDYTKVFDILKVSCANYEHVGVYVGNGKVCHFSKDRNGTYIDNWEDFKKYDGFSGNIDSSEATVYHPMIPFKNPKRIAEQISWAVDNNFRKNNYDLRNRNCEHFANMVVYGINYSQQVENKKGLLKNTPDFFRGFFAPFTFGATIWAIDSPTINNNKGSTIKITDEMNESNSILGEKYNWLSDEIKARIEVPPKEYCQIT